MERNSFKEYSVLAMVSKEEQRPIKACYGLYWNTERRNAGTLERRNAGTLERRNTETRNTETRNTKLLKPGTYEK